MARKKAVFATSSPRRKEMISGIYGGRIRFADHALDEKAQRIPHSPAGLKKLAILKARSIAAKYPGAIIISADTEVFCSGRMLGKPSGPGAAEKMLRRISGKNVIVMTSVAVLDTVTGKSSSFSVRTSVKIRELSPAEIKWYIGTGEPMDKAGAFAVQGKGALLVEGIAGDYFNVVGLPLSRFCAELKKYGVVPD